MIATEINFYFPTAIIFRENVIKYKDKIGEKEIKFEKMSTLFFPIYNSRSVRTTRTTQLRETEKWQIEDATLPTHKGATKQSEDRASRLMIQRGSLLTQLFALITLMKHLISPRVLQAAGVWPISAPSLTRISLPSTLPFPPPLPSNLVQREGSLLVLSLSSISRIIISSFSHHPAVSANNRTSFRPVYTCNARGHRPLSRSCRAHTITVIYCITGARLYGPLIAARISDRRCVSKSVENRILYRQLPQQRDSPLSSRVGCIAILVMRLRCKHCKISWIPGKVPFDAGST